MNFHGLFKYIGNKLNFNMTKKSDKQNIEQKNKL
jgi:hypothetical protein